MKKRNLAIIALSFVLVTTIVSLFILQRRRVTSEPSPPDPREAIDVNSFYGTYDVSTKEVGLPAHSLDGPKRESWVWQVSRSKGSGYRIGVLFPNREENDVYWKSIRLGVEDEATLSKATVKLLVSDDYTHVEQHQHQFESLAKDGVDAIVLGAIHYRSMDTLVERATSGFYGKKIPVIAVCNDIYAATISGKVLVSFLDMGKVAGQFVYDEALAKHKEDVSIAFLPGPINAGWAPDSLRGFLAVMRRYPGHLRVIPPEWGSPDPKTQSALLESILEKNQKVDYIIGNAVAVAEAARILRIMGREREVRVISTYYNLALDDELKNDRVEAAPWDQTEALGRIAVGMAIRILNGEKPGVDVPFQVGPSIKTKLSHREEQALTKP